MEFVETEKRIRKNKKNKSDDNADSDNVSDNKKNNEKCFDQTSHLRYKKIRRNGRDIFIPDDIDEDHLKHKQYINNWSSGNTDALRNWKISLSKAAFTYQYFLETTRIKLNRMLILALIISTISTIISGISTIALTVDSETTIISGNSTSFGGSTSLRGSTNTTTTENSTYKTTALIINAIIFFLSAVITVLNGIIKIYRLDEIISTVTSYIEKIDQIYSKIASELILPEALREDAITFIKRESDNYLKLIQQSPNIDKSIERNAIHQYNKYLEDTGMNFRLSQKYGNDAIIEVT